MRNINVVAKKMARNDFKIAISLGCAFHFESEFILPEGSESAICIPAGATKRYQPSPFHSPLTALSQ